MITRDQGWSSWQFEVRVAAHVSTVEKRAYCVMAHAYRKFLHRFGIDTRPSGSRKHLLAWRLSQAIKSSARLSVNPRQRSARCNS